MSLLRWTIFEWDVVWKNPQENLRLIEQALSFLKSETDVVALPEMFTTGFVKNPTDIAEPHPGTTLVWMQTIAEKHQLAICGTIATKENNQIFNRFYWVNPDKTFFFYDKRHLFRLGGEHKSYGAGKTNVIIPFKGWKIKPLICYDLRFPVWSRNTYENNSYAYDLLLYPANWPTSRIHIWEILLKARAIENMCISIGINRTGTDGNGWEYPGKSMLCFPDGSQLPTEDYVVNDIMVKQTMLDLIKLNAFRESFPVAKDWDKFNLIDI